MKEEGTVSYVRTDREVPESCTDPGAGKNSCSGKRLRSNIGRSLHHRGKKKEKKDRKEYISTTKAGEKGK